MSADLLHRVAYVLAGGILGVGTVLVIGRMIPGMIDRLTHNIDEQKEIFPDEQGNALWDQENFDEDTTQQMLDWYYSKSRAV